MLNKDIVQGKWREIKGEILKSWGELTDDQVEKFKGNVLGLAGELQQKFGYKKEETETKLNDITNRFAGTINDKVFGDEDEYKPNSDVTSKEMPRSGYDM